MAKGQTSSLWRSAERLLEKEGVEALRSERESAKRVKATGAFGGGAEPEGICQVMTGVTPLGNICQVMTGVTPLGNVCEVMTGVTPMGNLCEVMTGVTPLGDTCEVMTGVTPLGGMCEVGTGVTPLGTPRAAEGRVSAVPGEEGAAAEGGSPQPPAPRWSQGQVYEVKGDGQGSVVIQGKLLGGDGVRHEVYFVGDQGSSITIMGDQLYNLLFPNEELLPAPALHVSSVDGGPTQPLGYKVLTLILGGHDFDYPVLIVPGFRNVFLPGIDFFNAHRYTKPDPDLDYYIFDGDKRVDFQSNPMYVGRSEVTVKCHRSRDLAPHTVFTCYVTLDTSMSNYQPGDEGIFRPDPHFCRRTGLEVSNMLNVIGEERKIVVCMVNSTNQRVRLPTGTVVGYFQKVATVEAVDYIVDHSDLDYVGTAGALPKMDFGPSVNPRLSKEQREAMLEVLVARERAFAVNPKGPQPNLFYEHTIDTGAQRPVKSSGHRTGPAEDEAIRKEVNTMLEHGIVRSSRSPWAHPVVLTKKPDGSWRFCFDGRKLNELTKKDAYAVPRVDDLLSRFQGAEYFTTIDCAAGFWQVPLDADSIEKTAFVTKMGLFEFLKMPFGLTNAPAAFQRLMDGVLGDLRWTCAVCFIDDVCVYSSSWAQHLQDVDAVLGSMEAAGISAKLSKCNFGQQEIRFLGWIINREGIKGDPEKIKAIKDYPIPTNIHELQAALGLFGYYRPLVYRYSHVAHPLHQLLKTKPDEAGEKAKKEGAMARRGADRQRHAARKVIAQLGPAAPAEAVALHGARPSPPQLQGDLLLDHRRVRLRVGRGPGPAQGRARGCGRLLE